MRQVLPSRLRHRLNALAFTTIQGVGDGAPVAVSPDVLIALSQAARAAEVLRFDYAGERREGGDAAMPPRRVEPHHVVSSDGRWYLVAWDLDRDDWRIFRADRITPRIPTGPRFTPRELPGGDVSEFVSARFKGSAGANRWPCTGKVILGLPASDVLPFAGHGIVEDLGDGRCSLEAGSWSWIALAASLGRFDTEVHVVESPQLAEAFARLAERNAAAAGGDRKEEAPTATTQRGRDE